MFLSIMATQGDLASSECPGYRHAPVLNHQSGSVPRAVKKMARLVGLSFALIHFLWMLLFFPQQSDTGVTLTESGDTELYTSEVSFYLMLSIVIFVFTALDIKTDVRNSLDGKLPESNKDYDLLRMSLKDSLKPHEVAEWFKDLVFSWLQRLVESASIVYIMHFIQMEMSYTTEGTHVLSCELLMVACIETCSCFFVVTNLLCVIVVFPLTLYAILFRESSLVSKYVGPPALPQDEGWVRDLQMKEWLFLSIVSSRFPRGLFKFILHDIAAQDENDIIKRFVEESLESVDIACACKNDLQLFCCQRSIEKQIP
ncbi:unnamed protein product [Nezara viridula]|uniref:Uncharacterized protein n=1 Tax=Nezara viridula TaxID=85310 RepID=A0A9P0MHQ4_NEZVI|nr:unnamed protein product [Nezara viridula]